MSAWGTGSTTRARSIFTAGAGLAGGSFLPFSWDNHDQRVVGGFWAETVLFALGAGSGLRGGSVFRTGTTFSGGSGFGVGFARGGDFTFGALGAIFVLGPIMVGWATDFAISSSALLLSSAACV